MGSRKDPTLSFILCDADSLKSMSAEEKLSMIEERMRQALEIRVSRCKAEAAGLASDMEVVGKRLSHSGHRADIGSVRVAGYHIAQTELQVLTRAYSMIRSIMGGKESRLDPEEEEADE